MDSSDELQENETLMCSVSTLNNKHHYDVFMKSHIIEELYNMMLNVIDNSRIVRGEFEKVLIENKYSPYFN